MELLIFGDGAASLIKAAILFSFGLFLAGMTYLLLVYPSLRRQEYRGFSGYSKRSALLVGVIITLIFAISSYYSSLSPFFAVELMPSQVRLIYYYPPHQTTLVRPAIDRFDRRIEPTKAGARMHLLVFTNHGRVFESAALKPEVFENRYQRLEQWFKAG